MIIAPMCLAFALAAGLAAPALAQEETPQTPDHTQAAPTSPDDGITGEPLPPSAPLTSSERIAQEDARARAYNTLTPPLATTPSEKRVAALAYMDSALALLDMARTHLRDADSSPRAHALAQSELTAASGKATIALLLMFHDKEAADRIRPLALQLGDAVRTAFNDPTSALAMVERDRPQLASVYQSTLATMGGGAGGQAPKR